MTVIYIGLPNVILLAQQYDMVALDEHSREGRYDQPIRFANRGFGDSSLFILKRLYA